MQKYYLFLKVEQENRIFPCLLEKSHGVKLYAQCQVERQFDEQADGSAAVARIAAQSAPDDAIEEIHDQAGNENECRPFHLMAHEP